MCIPCVMCGACADPSNAVSDAEGTCPECGCDVKPEDISCPNCYTFLYRTAKSDKTPDAC